MTTIDSRLIDAKIKEVEQQRDEYFALYHRTLGALMALENLKAELAVVVPERTVEAASMEEVASALGADTAELVPTPTKKD